MCVRIAYLLVTIHSRFQGNIVTRFQVILGREKTKNREMLNNKIYKKI